MPRPERLAEALDALRRHMAVRQSGLEPDLFAFWIHGRSGSGKSVLLVQLLRSLVLDHHLPVVWLDDASEHLATFLRIWDERAPLDATPPFIFVDDFYAPQRRQTIPFADINRLMRNSSRVRWPVLITCGPPEHWQDFIDSAESESWQVGHWRIPPVTVTEQVELRHWYSQRTGERLGERGPAFQQPEGLMISLMLELKHGEARAFGHRFVDRLQEANLAEALALPLALNRLYVWTPASWFADLSTVLQEEFARFNTDRDFDLQPDVSVTGQIRLTHPHISNLIYLTLRPQTEGLVRADDLVEAFRRSLRTSASTALAIIQAVANGESRVVVDLNARRLAEGLVREWRGRPTDHSLSRAQQGLCWANWARYAGRDTHARVLLEADQPFEHASACLKEDLSIWSTLWSALWQLAPGHSNLISIADTWLPTHLNHVAWPHVWQDLFGLTASIVPPGLSPASLARLGLQWLESHGHRPEWSHVWQKLLEHPGALPPTVSEAALVERGVAWLAGREDRPEWNYVWHALLEHPGALPPTVSEAALVERGVAWLAGREDRPEWNYVWQKLLEHPGALPPTVSEAALAERGVAWLAGREDRPEWAHVWQKLLEHPGALPPTVSEAALAERGVAWLAGREDRPEWAHVWRALLEHPGALPPAVSEAALAERGVAWLAGREDRPEWSHVWQALLEHPGALPPTVSEAALVERGVAWLAGREDRPEWSHVWQALKKHLGALPPTVSEAALVERGVAWLAGREDRPEWSHVWQALKKHLGALPLTATRATTLFEQGLAWLTGREERADWYYVWRTLLDHRDALTPMATGIALLERGVAWLAGREDRPEWAHVWRALLEHPEALPPTAPKAAVFERGVAWLAGREDRPEWAHVWQKLLEHPGALPPAVSEAALGERGVAWLAGREDRPEWAHVWQKLLEHPGALPPTVSEAALGERGVAWLAGREDRPEWAHVWQKLLEHPGALPPAVSEAALGERGVAWLAGREDRPEWNHVWHALLEHPRALPPTVSEAALVERGVAWLAGREDRPEWPYIMQATLGRRRLLSSQSLGGLLGLCRSWLSSNGADRAWPYVWQALIEHTDSLEDFRGLLLAGHEWLQAYADHLNWNLTWEMAYRNRGKLIQMGIDYIAFLQLGLCWLDQNPDHPSWSFVWQRLYEQRLEFADPGPLEAAGLAWLARDRRHAGWPIAFEILMAGGHRSRAHLTLGIEWIEANAHAGPVPKLFENLINAYADIDLGALTRSALAWLNQDVRRKGWFFVWRSVWVKAPSPEAFDLALRWFSTRTPSTQGPNNVVDLIRLTESDHYRGLLHAWALERSDQVVAQKILKCLNQTLPNAGSTA